MASTRAVVSPCDRCPYREHRKAIPKLPPGMKLVCVGIAPGAAEEQQLTPFVGETGQRLRAALREAGLDDVRDVGYINLTRCRPPQGIGGDDFEDPTWAVAYRCCTKYFAADLAKWQGPLLLLGTIPLQKVLKESKAKVTNRRGLWYRTPEGRDAFVTFHPSYFVRLEKQENSNWSKEERAAVRAEALRLATLFRADVRKAVDRVLRREVVPNPTIRILKSPLEPEARRFFATLAEHEGLWFFDIETYDALEVPSRKGVSTNAFHPDFRTRGVAIATSPDRGFWIDFVAAETRKDEARAIMSPAFESGAEKGAFNGGFDENGLVVPRWIRRIANRTRDPWLTSLALDQSGTHQHSLMRLVVQILGEPQPKEGVDPSMIATMSLEAVAEYGVKDACAEYRLELALRKRLREGRYI